MVAKCQISVWASNYFSSDSAVLWTVCCGKVWMIPIFRAQLSTQCYALASRIGSAFKAVGLDRDGVKPGIQTAYVHFETN